MTRLSDRLPAVVATAIGLGVVAGLYAWIEVGRSGARPIYVPLVGGTADGEDLRFALDGMDTRDGWVALEIAGDVATGAGPGTAGQAQTADLVTVFGPARLTPLIGSDDPRCCAYARLLVAPNGAAWLDGFADEARSPIGR